MQLPETDIPRDTRVIDVLQKARSTADWDLVTSIYRQCIHIVNDLEGTYLPDSLPGKLAEAVARVAANYIGAEEQLAWHALAVFADADTVPHEVLGSKEFRKFYQDERFHRFWNYSPELANRLDKRRRPYPFEAVVESSRRLRDLNAIANEMRAGGHTVGVLGGSLGYGRFYSVAGCASGRSSDLDLVVVIEQAEQLPDLTDRLAAVPGVSAKNVTALHRRAQYFLEDGLDDGRTAFSHKVTMWDRGTGDPLMRWARVSARYALSLHFLTVRTLDYLLVADSTKLMQDMVGTKRSLRDYRETPTSREDHQRSFGGRNHRLGLELEDTRGGYLRRSRVYVIDNDDHYYPGMFQNLISPRFDIRWEADLNLQAKLDSFRWKIIERLQYERRIRPHEFLRLSLSHTRSEIFAPHITHAIDSSAVTE